MAELIHSTESDIKGPFLIDRSQLESLDRILQEEWSRLETERERALDDAIENEYKEERGKSWNKEINNKDLRSAVREKLGRSYEFTRRRECLITLKGGAAVTLADLGSALRDPDLHDKEPTGLVVTMQSCKRECTVTLESRWGCRLKVEVSPKRDQLVQQTLTVLKNWQNSVRPPLWQKWWRILTGFGLQWSVWFMTVVLTLLILADGFKIASKEGLRNQALQLVTNGIPADKQGKAMELLLANAFNYHPTKALSNYPNWFVLLVFGGLAYCIALSIKPTVAVAIGRGEGKVRFWRGYSKFILITTPTFVFVIFFWPKIEGVLKALF